MTENISDLAKASVIIIDDDDDFRLRLMKSFKQAGYDVSAFAEGKEALLNTAQESPEWALVDLRLGAEWGLKFVKELHLQDAATKIIVLTAYGSIATAMEAVRLGAIDFLQKPVSFSEIIAAFERSESPIDEEPRPPGDVPSLARAEWEHINRVLAECGGSIRKAAQLLGLHRRSLQRKLAKYPVNR